MADSRWKFAGLIASRLKGFFYLLKKGRLKEAYNYLWVHAFTRDSGLALFDPVLRKFPFLISYPETAEIEITTRCHLKCTMCEHTYWYEPARDMSFDEFRKIIDQFPDLKWLGVTGIGSNFLNKDFVRMLVYAKSRSIYVEFFDTFDLIDEKNARALIEAGVNKIWMSIDGATKKTYDGIRVGTSFEKVTANARRLMELKKEYKTPFPEIWFHYIVSEANSKELPDFVRLVKDMTKSGTNLATMIYFSNLLSFDQVQHMRGSLSKEVKTETENTAKGLGIYLGWNENIKPSRQVKECTRWTEPFILATGHVQSCCAINEANTRQYQKENSLGNLLERDFHDIWKKEFSGLISEIHSNRLPKICKHCRTFLHD